MKSSREKKGRQTGGQLGYIGHTLHHVYHPDHVIRHPMTTTCDGYSESIENEPVVRSRSKSRL